MKATAKRTRAARWLRGHGIEIGALHNPLPVPAGAWVRYVDRLTVDDLRHHYPELDGEQLVPIDLIGDAEDLSVVADASLDFVVANHLVEHLENPIRGIAEMTRVLRPGGILYMALPDPRMTFDRNRALTSIEHVVDEFHHGTEANREAHFVDFVENAEPPEDFLLTTTTGSARVRELMDRNHSIHFHVWRPDNFLDVLVAARNHASVDLELLEFMACDPGADDEYIFVFAKGIASLPPGPPADPTEAKIDTLQRELQTARAEADRADQGRYTAEDRMARVIASRSWRMTVGIRAAAQLARRAATRIPRGNRSRPG